MTNDEKEYISAEKKKELEDELAELKGPRRKVILDSIEFAKSLGDLSENAEYQQAREDQGKLEERILKIEHILKTSIIVSKNIKHEESISIGSIVSVQKVGSKDINNFQIVGSEEADVSQNKISNKSPLGEALLGKREGDLASFMSPVGIVEYKILAVNKVNKVNQVN